MKVTVIWDIAPCSLYKFNDVSDVIIASIKAFMMMEEVRISEMSVNFRSFSVLNLHQILLG